MSRSKPVSLHIMDKDYVVSCPQEECDNLMASATYLNSKMQEVRESGKIVSTERIAVMTALNIVHELLEHKEQKVGYNSPEEKELKRLEEKIQHALETSFE